MGKLKKVEKKANEILQGLFSIQKRWKMFAFFVMTIVLGKLFLSVELTRITAATLNAIGG